VRRCGKRQAASGKRQAAVRRDNRRKRYRRWFRGGRMSRFR
jgi:hypothetical protein